MRGPDLTRHALLVAAATTLLACNDPSSSDSPYIVTPVSSTMLSGTAGWTLTDTLVVEVRDAEGNPVPNAKVTWSLPNGGSLVVQLAEADDQMSGRTDGMGRNYAVWTLGLDEGAQVLKASSGEGVEAEFAAMATVLHARKISVGGSYACAILLDRRPVCWGTNSVGELGTGGAPGGFTTVPSSPVGLTAVLEIRATLEGLTCALDLSGDVWCWGRNWAGEAGPAAAQPAQLTPVRVAGAEGAVSLAAAKTWNGHACAILGRGGAVCWGYNGGGQLGSGDLVSSATPRAVVGSGSFRSIYAGGSRSCALDPDGEVWCWGDGQSAGLAPLPNDTFTSPTRPVPGVRYTSLAVGAFTVCGIQVGGEASCWGNDNGSFGHLPRSNLQPGDSPVRPDLAENLAQLVSDGQNGMYARSRYGLGYAWGETGCCDVYTLPPQMITPSLRAAEIAAGQTHYCIISETGSVYCGRTNWWSPYFLQSESLIGIPDVVDP